MKTLITLVIFLTSIALAEAQSEFVQDEVLIQIKPGENAELLLSRYAAFGNPRINERLSEIMNIYKISFSPSSPTAPQLLRSLKKDKRILNAQLNHYIQKRETVPNDPQLPAQWQHINDGSNNGIADADIDTDLAWDITTGGLTALGDTIVACVIEGGNLLHEDLIENAWFNYNEIPDNGIDDDENGFIDDYRGWNVDSENDQGVYNGGHGTNVMGMIGAKGNNEMGVVGANWDVKIMSVTGESVNDEASVIEAYNYPLVQRKLYEETNGEKGAFVVVTNASWGIDFGDPADVPLWSAYYDTLGVYGILNCGATANNAVDIDEVGDIPTGVESDYMISVTATNNSDVRTFSAYGLVSVDLGAPGSNIFTTSGGSNYTNTSGTSFASPLTAGVIALLYSAPCEDFANTFHDSPQAAADYVRSVLFNGVDPIENLQGEVATGGRLNAFNSLNLIMGACGEDICMDPFAFNYEISNDTILSFNWNSLSTNDTVVLRYKPVNAEEWTYISGIATNNYSFNDLNYCTPYEFEIASECSGDVIEELNFTHNTVIETSGCCVAPETLLEENISNVGASFIWEIGFNIDEYEIYFRHTGEPEWMFAGTSSNGNFEFFDLDSCTYYDILLKPACVEGFEESLITQIRTTGCGQCVDTEYCESIGESTEFEYIESILIGNYSNVSGDDNGYNFFDGTGLELEVGAEYAIELTPGFQGQTFPELFMLWIDLDQDGQFSLEEILFESTQGSDQTTEGSIFIPEEALLGNTRMRIALQWEDPFGASFNPCTNIDEGEVEDYCLNLVQSTLGLSDLNRSEFNLFPNPNQGRFYLKINSGTFTMDQYMLEILDLSGKKIAFEPVQTGTTPVDLDLAAGAYIYILSINGTPVHSNKLIVTK